MSRTLQTLARMASIGIILAATGQVLAGAMEEHQNAQNKLMAARSARVEAMRRLSERINGLLITSETYVRDFVAANDSIRSEMASWLSGMKEVGDPTYTPDGVCQVTLEVTVREVVVQLKRLHKEYYKGDKVRYEDIDQIIAHTKDTTLRETGQGIPGAFVPRGVPASGQDIMSAKAWEYWKSHCTVQGRLLAERAARVEALRRLGERIEGVLITSDTRVKDFVASSDEIRTQLASFLTGAVQTGIRYHDNELLVEVEMEVTVRELILNLQRWHKEYYRNNRVTVEDIERVSGRALDKVIRETGMGIPPEDAVRDLGPKATSVTIGTQMTTWPPVVRATGQAALDATSSNAAQAKLMALRAAEMEARRKLGEQLAGLTIASQATVKDFVAMNDQINTSMQAFLQGSYRVNGSEKVLPDGTVEVTVEIDVKPLWNMVLFYQEKLDLQVR